jgi:hypothetical protein
MVNNDIDLPTRKHQAILKFLELEGVSDVYRTHSAVDVSYGFVVYTKDELLSDMKHQSLKDHVDRSYHFDTIVEVTQKSLSDVEDFFVADVLLQNGEVEKKFVYGSGVNRFIDGWMAEKVFTDKFAEVCFNNNDYADFIGSEYRIIDDLYVFDIES